MKFIYVQISPMSSILSSSTSLLIYEFHQRHVYPPTQGSAGQTIYYLSGCIEKTKILQPAVSAKFPPRSRLSLTPSREKTNHSQCYPDRNPQIR